MRQTKQVGAGQNAQDRVLPREELELPDMGESPIVLPPAGNSRMLRKPMTRALENLGAEAPDCISRASSGLVRVIDSLELPPAAYRLTLAGDLPELGYTKKIFQISWNAKTPEYVDVNEYRAPKESEPQQGYAMYRNGLHPITEIHEALVAYFNGDDPESALSD